MIMDLSVKRTGIFSLRLCVFAVIKTLIQRHSCLPVIIALLLCSCGHLKDPEEVIIIGHFENAAGKKILLSMLLPGETIRIDSSVISKKGTCSFTFKPENTGFYLLSVSGSQQIPIVTEKGETINLSGDLKTKPNNFTITGSPGSSLLKDFFNYSDLNLKKADSLTDILRHNQDKPGFYRMTRDFDPLFKKIMEDQRAFERRFILSHRYSIVSLVILNYHLGLKPVLSPMEDFDLFLLLDSTLSARYPQNKQVIFHHQRVLEIQKGINSQ